MTAKDHKNKGGVERGVTREQRAIKRRERLEASFLPSGSYGPKCSNRKRMTRSMKLQAKVAALRAFDGEVRAIEEKRFGDGGLPNREVPFIPFKEKPFGDEVKGGQELSGFSVVSLALFDGLRDEKNMLFACSGIAIPQGTAIQQLTRFVTSACLVNKFIEKRNRDDNFRVQVRFPDNTIQDGFLGLYDEDIAIVTSFDNVDVDPLDLDLLASPDHSDGHVSAAGRAFNSGSLMTMRGSLSNESLNIFLPDSQGLTEAALGGPLVGSDGSFHGMIVDLCNDGDANRKCAKFLSQKSLYERLGLFQILNPQKLHFRDYSLSPGVKCVIPSGFMRTYRLRSLGYPMPPPLVLEFNGELLNGFEDDFGELLAWSGYPYVKPSNYRRECVWAELEKKVVNKISRSVVSLASFNGDYSRSFVCTGLLIKWHGSRAKRTVVLTSASLVRSRRDIEGNIDRNLRIEVFLPPNQRRDGTLELYDLDKNIAIVSVKKCFNIQPEDIFNKGMQKSSSEKVVALGREPTFGLLMGTIGKVKHNYNDRKLECQELRCSTCKIKKAAIGGPLIDFHGTFVGMNFYDGRDLTPFLPRDTVVDALQGLNDFPLPSERRSEPERLDAPGEKGKRWPVPEPYWYHGALDEDMYDVPELMGRTLM